MNQSKEPKKIISANKEQMKSDFRVQLHQSSDLMVKEEASGITLMYIDTLIEKNMLQQNIIRIFKENSLYTIEDILEKVTVAEVEMTNYLDDAILSALNGSVIIHVDDCSTVILAKIPSKTARSLSTPENESLVIGSQLGFNESLSTNISILRQYIKGRNFCNETFHIGTHTHTKVSLVYINGIASEQLIYNLRKRISKINIDGILDSSVLCQLIEDNSMSIFPQMALTERPDRISSWLLNGKLAVLVDGSSLAICCPQTFVEFFQSMEDQNVRWHIATFLRFLRMVAVFLSIFFTAIYVAALTFHYEIIPQALLIPLSESRSRVPFPPIIEAFLLEFMIELLREAGARLPTKIGQSISIVGGIVIGTAAVDAGFTSNILIIIVSLGALGSFVTPSYTMGNVIRILRFPLILLAGFWGFYGIMFGFCFLILHILRQSTLGSPFLLPYYPPRFADWKDSIVRLPLALTSKRAYEERPADDQKYNPGEAREKNEN